MDSPVIVCVNESRAFKEKLRRSRFRGSFSGVFRHIPSSLSFVTVHEHGNNGGNCGVFDVMELSSIWPLRNVFPLVLF